VNEISKTLEPQVRRKLKVKPTTTGDKVFFGVSSTAASVAFVLVTLILIFLFIRALPALQSQGIDFILGSEWNPENSVMQIFPMIWGSILIAALGVVLATPMAISTAYLIVFVMGQRASNLATTLVDLLAALPSVVLGLWGLWVFTPVGEGWGQILNQYFSWIPIFQVTDVDAGFRSSPFIGGWIVAIMIVPIITSVTREIFSQLDRDLIGGALALGGSKASIFRQIILPTCARGITGGVLLGVGRALGETVAIFYVIDLSFEINWSKLLEPEGGAVASLILARFGEASPEEISGLMAAGLVIFFITLIINFIANGIVARSKAGRR
jgi:phosphate transport system permease protein